MALTQVSPGLLDTQANAQGFRNRIINGDMRIDQRNAGASVATSSSFLVYSVDRWYGLYYQTSKFTMQQNAGSVTPPAGFTNYLGCTSTSAYTVGSGETFYIRQSVEGFNIADLAWGTANAKTITISFWVRSSLTGTFGGALQNSAADRSYPFSYTISSANTWEQKSVTIAGDTSGTWLTNNGVGVGVQFSLGTGSTISGTAGSWQAANLSSATGATSVVGTNGATFYITGVQLEVGSVATPFERLDYGRQLIQCQRYFLVGPTGASGQWVLTTAADLAYGFPVEMRAAPTVSHLNNYTVVSYGVASRTVTATSLSGTANTRGCLIAVTSTGATAGTPAGANSNGVGFSAEL